MATTQPEFTPNTVKAGHLIEILHDSITYKAPATGTVVGWEGDNITISWGKIEHTQPHMIGGRPASAGRPVKLDDLQVIEGAAIRARPRERKRTPLGRRLWIVR